MCSCVVAACARAHTVYVLGYARRTHRIHSNIFNNNIILLDMLLLNITRNIK